MISARDLAESLIDHSVERGATVQRLFEAMEILVDIAVALDPTIDHHDVKGRMN